MNQPVLTADVAASVTNFERVEIDSSAKSDSLMRQSEASEDDDLEEPERRITFLDAVVAIAMTLLILPLMDAVSEYSEYGINENEYYVNVQNEDDATLSSMSGTLTVQEFVHEKQGLISTFLVSFLVIAKRWGEHAFFVRKLQYLNRAISLLMWAWLFLIVCMPVVTILAHNISSLGSHFVYVGTILALKISELGMVLCTRKDMKRIYKADAKDITGRSMVSLYVDMILILIATPITLTPIGYWAIVLLLPAGPFITNHAMKRFPPPLAKRY